MGVFSEIIDTINAVDLKSQVKDLINKNKFGSISRKAAEGTLQFPVLVSRSMDIDTLQIISKALERQFSSFTQTVLTMSPILNVDKDKNAAGYLSKFHQNTGVKNSAANIASSVMDNYNCYTSEDGSTVLLACTCEGSTGGVINANKEQLQSRLDYIRQDKLNDKFNPQTTIYKFANESLSKHYNSRVLEAGNESASRNRIGEKVLLDNDVKKSNELIPTTLHVKVILNNEKGDNLGTEDFIIGIKSIMHPINSDEMVSNMVSACQNNNKFFDFLRWTTGEISFFKDFVFNIKEIKDDVFKRSSGASPWWITLKRRKSLAKINSVVPGTNQILPNTTIVLSMQEADFIKSQYGFDIMNPVFVDKIMQTFFLLGLVVVDTSTQIAHFLFDGQGSFQSVTFNGLQRENSASVDTKEILKLINRI